MNDRATTTSIERAGEDDDSLHSRSLSDEHANLLQQVTARCQAVSVTALTGDWPTHELYQLVDYLHVEVLQQMVNEEWLLFRESHNSEQALDRLRTDHLELRLSIEALTLVTGDTARPTLRQLTDEVTNLRAALADHFTTEQASLEQAAATPSTSSLGGIPHHWYADAAGPVIDLVNLPGPLGIEVVLGRLLRMERGERIELRAATDPRPLWRRLAAADPDGYGFTYLLRGPQQWAVEIERRPAS